MLNTATNSINTDLSMKGKVALVTGASSGLGAHFAQVLAAAGAKVVLGARRTDKLQNQVEKIRGKGGEAFAVLLDVTSSDSIKRALDTTEARFGSVTVLINNAGVSDSKRFINVDEESWDFIMDTNLKGVWRLASVVSQRLLANKLSGSIVNISSILGLRVGFGESSYAISKAAVLHMTKAMALELGHKGIRVNALCPGFIKTELNTEYLESDAGLAFIKKTPAQRLGLMEELNGPLLMLASDAGSFINGIALPVDGGHLNSSL